MFHGRGVNLESMSDAGKAAAAARGRQWLLAVIAFYGLLAVAGSAAEILFRDQNQLAAIGRVVLVAVLFALTYLGNAWARYLTAILFLVSAAVAGSLLFTDAMTGPKVIAALLGVLFLAGFGILGFARPILFFERIQQERRRKVE